jgi:hypothetical protein
MYHIDCSIRAVPVDAFMVLHHRPARLPHPRLSFVVSVVCSSSFRTFVLRLVMYRTLAQCHLTTCDDWSVHMPSAWGRAELRVGAAAVAIGVGSPVARLGADGWRTRESRAAVGAVGAVDAVCALGAGAAVVAVGVGGVETRPLARPPKGTQKKSLDAAVA